MMVRLSNAFVKKKNKILYTYMSCVYCLEPVLINVIDWSPDMLIMVHMILIGHFFFSRHFKK